MQKISKKSWLSGGIHILKSKKYFLKNQQDFSPFPRSGHLVDPFDPTVLRPQAKGLPFRNNESLQHSYLSKVNERFCESLGATAAVVLGSCFLLRRKAHCVLPCWKKRCLTSWVLRDTKYPKGCRDIGYDMMHMLHQILTPRLSLQFHC